MAIMAGTACLDGDLHHIFGLRAFWAVYNFILNFLPLDQRLVPVTGNCAVMDKNVLFAGLFTYGAYWNMVGHRGVAYFIGVGSMLALPMLLAGLLFHLASRQPRG